VSVYNIKPLKPNKQRDLERCSSPSFSAKRNPQHCCGFFIFQKKPSLFVFIFENKKGKILLKNLGF